VEYFYDQTSYNGLTITNGKGRRTGMCDHSPLGDCSEPDAGITAWSYNEDGQVTTVQRTIAGVTKTFSFDYNLNGAPLITTYPSGFTLSHYYDTAGRPTNITATMYPLGFLFNAPQAATYTSVRRVRKSYAQPLL